MYNYLFINLFFKVMAKKSGTVKRPTLKRYPKRPKAGAPLSSWEKYDAKCKEVEKANSTRMSEYNKLVTKHKSDKKKKEAIIKKTTGLSGVALPKGKKR